MPPFSLPDFLADTRVWVESALDALVPPLGARPARLHAAMRHSLFAGGKRLRPALCVAAGLAFGAPLDDLRYPAAAIECLHTYTLIHDDLPCMDDDTLRRGRPTCHVAFDYPTALLAGDALQALAFQLAAQTPKNAAKVVLALAAAASSLGVVGGQQEDLESEKLTFATGDVDEPAADLTRKEALERLHYIQLHKTADLFRAPLHMGALAAGASDADLVPLTAYAEALGEAFQVADDILDATATSAQMGKSTGADAAHHKLTAVTLLGLDAARQRLEELTVRAADTLFPLQAQLAPEALAPLRAFPTALLRRTH